jgi:hypothetical protein
MYLKLVAAPFMLTCLILASVSQGAQDDKKKSGTIIGEVKSHKSVNDGKNTQIEVLAPGEEKARSYFVNHDPKIKRPIPSVLKAVRAANVGDRVELEWVATNHGPAITAFKVLKKNTNDKKDGGVKE